MSVSSKLVLCVENVELSFYEVKLHFEGGVTTDIFALKNNKTLAETLRRPKYRKLSREVQKYYHASLDQPLGNFLLGLKKANDPFYLKFLNPYGDKVYCSFCIDDPEYTAAKGLYAYSVDDHIKYIGRCLDNFQKRINQGYGHIHPKNCYIDGQQTNCRLNSLIVPVRDKIALHVCKLTNESEIKSFEAVLIQQLKQKHECEWNS